MDKLIAQLMAQLIATAEDIEATHDNAVSEIDRLSEEFAEAIKAAETPGEDCEVRLMDLIRRTKALVKELDDTARRW